MAKIEHEITIKMVLKENYEAMQAVVDAAKSYLVAVDTNYDDSDSRISAIYSMREALAELEAVE